MTLTRARTIQYVGILFSLMLIAVGYWYWSARAGVKTNTSASQSQGTGQLDSGLAGYWKLDEGSGTSAADSSTNGNTGTLTNGPTWTTGQIGSAVQFDGTNDYFSAAYSGTTLAQLTVSFWTYSSSNPGGQKGIFQWANALDSGSPFILLSDESAGPTSRLYIDAAYRATITLQNSVWNHVVITLDASNLWTIYVNGVAAGTYQDNATHDYQPNASSIYLGNGFGGYSAGKADELRVYNRALSSDEVGQLYRLTTPTATDTYLNGYWSFNGQDISGTAAYDRSGAGNTGTLTGGPARLAGIAGQALDFDGTDDYVTVSDNSALDVPSNFLTLSGWFNRDTATTDDVILAKRNGVAAANAGYIVYLDATTDKLVFEMSDGTDEFSLTSTTAFTTPGWHHFAITYEDDVNSTTQIYIDGLVNQAAKTGNLTDIGDITNALAFVVGAESDAGSPFDGKIDEIRMYQGIVLSAARIKTLFDQAQPDEKNTSGVQAAGVGRLESGLTAYWPLDDGTSGASPTTAADASTNSLAAGTLTNGPVWAAGQSGSSVDFDGTDDYIAVADTPLLDFGDTDDFTLSGWFNRESYTTDDVLVAKRTTLLAGANGYVTYIDDATDQIIFEVSDGTDEYSLTSTSTFSAASKVDWHHFAIVWDQDSPAQSEIYIDGIADNATDSGTIGNVGDLSNAVQFGIGVNSLAGDDFDGKIDEVRVYSRALSADEIVVLYRQATPTGVDTGLEGYWSFDSEATPGTIAYDRSGARNTGTLVNGPTAVIGRVGQALNVVAATSYVTVPDSASLSPTAAMTFSFWLRPTGTISGSEKLIVTKSGVSQRTFHIASTSAGAVKLYLASGIGDSGSNYGVSPDGVLVLNQWTHVTTVFDGAGTGNAGRAKIYINGIEQLVTYTGTIAATIPDSTSSLNIGNNLTATYDEARFYSRALTAAEIKSLYDASAPDKGNSSSSQPQGTGRLDSGLAGYWKLDETTGSSASDASTSGNTGTLTNMENGDWVTGQIGNGLSFDGSNEYVLLSDSAIFDPGGKASWCHWFYPTANQSGRGMFSQDVSSGRSASTYKWLTYLTASSGQLAGYVRIASTAYQVATVDSGAGYYANAWHHLCLTFDRSLPSSRLKLYVDGVPVGSADAADGDIDGGNWPNLARWDVAFFQGHLDDVRLYSRPLSADEVGKLYRLTTPTGVDTSLKGYWSFNGTDMSGTTAFDRSGSGNNGTLTNSPTKTIGKLGQGLSFDGTDDFVASVANSSAVAALTQGSFAFWLKPRGVSTQGVIFRSGADGGGNSPTSGFEISGDLWAGTQAIRFMTAGSTGDMMARSTTMLSLNTWTHVVVVWDGTLTAANVKFYLNGALDTTVTQFNGSGSYVASDGSFSFGIPDGGGYRLDGILDEFRVYNRQLSADEVIALYNQSK